MKKWLKYTQILLILSFIEGGAVMACELLGAKMIAPFFGGSLYVWAAVLGTTLGALTTGYYLGGFISHKIKQKELVLWVLMVAGILLMFMPFTSRMMMIAMLNQEVRLGATVSLLVFSFPQLMLFGITSPLIIDALNTEVETSGKIAGSVYAISTTGGIITTFVMGFYIIPTFGLKSPAIIYGLILVIASAIVLLAYNKSLKNITMIIIFLIVSANVILLDQKSTVESPNYKIQYESEGILGQVRVVDVDNFSTYIRGSKPGRILLVNNTPQSILDLNNPKYDLWDWSYYYPTSVSMFPEGSDVLLLGLGGGTFVNQFQRLGYNVEAVELDQRLKDVAIKYFFIDPATKIIIDDARHYLNISQKEYDIIAIDLFFSETPPPHVLTLETFERIKEILKPGGAIMINFYGFLSGERGKAARSIYKTLETIGYKVNILPTPGEDERYRNLFFIASLDPLDFSKIRYDETEVGLPKITDLKSKFIDRKTLDLEDAVILTDQIPLLDKLYLPAALEWRKGVNAFMTRLLIENDLDLFR